VQLEARLQADALPMPASRDDLEGPVRRSQFKRDRASEGIEKLAQQVARARGICREA
jgi:hypothetical protein